GQYMPLLLLLILTVSLGLYTASAARTLDRNFVDEIMFTIGADLALKEQWSVPSSGPPGGIPGGPGGPAGQGGSGGPGGGASALPAQERIYEPPFYIHTELPGVEAAARVLQIRATARAGGRHLGETD